MKFNLKNIFKSNNVDLENKTKGVFTPVSQVYNTNNEILLLDFFKNWSGICVNKRADSIASISNYVATLNKEGTYDIVNSDNWLSQLIKNPNKPNKLTFNEIKRLAVQWLDFSGNVYLWTPLNGLKVPTQIWILPSNNVIINPGQNEMVASYEVRTPKGTFVIPSNEMCHIKTIMPSSVWERNYIIGSPVRLYNAIDSINADYKMKSFIKRHFEQEALAPMILRGEFNGGQSEVDSIKGQLRRSGVYNSIAGVVSNDVAFETLPQSNLANQTINGSFSTSQNAIQISAAFGIPYGMLDTTSQVNFATADINYMTFRNETIEPLMLLIESYLDLHFSQFESNLFIKHDSYEYTDKTNELERLKLVVGANVITINELREQYSLPKINEGDVLINSVIQDVTNNVLSPTKELKKKV